MLILRRKVNRAALQSGSTKEFYCLFQRKSLPFRQEFTINHATHLIAFLFFKIIFRRKLWQTISQLRKE